MRTRISIVLPCLPLAQKPLCIFAGGLLLGFMMTGQAAALDGRKLELVGLVKTIATRETHEGSSNALVYSRIFDRLGNEVKIISGGERNGEFISSIETIHVYNSQGQKTSAKEFWNDGSHLRDRFFYYDEQGNQTLEISYKPDGVLEDVLIYIYDDMGHWIERTYFKGGNIFSREKSNHTYDAKKRRVETTLWDNAGIKHKKIYNVEEKVIEEFSYREAGSIKLRRIRQYDNRNNLIRNQAFNQEGTLLQKIVTTYEYDDIGNWIKSVSQWLVKDGNPYDEVNITRRTITYYDPSDTDSK